MARVRTRKRGDTYSYIFEAGKVNGKRKVIEKGGFATQAEAYEAGVAAFTDWKHGGVGITSEKMTVREYLEIWADVVRRSTSLGTQHAYANNIKLINSCIGDVLLQELRPSDVVGMLNALHDRGLAYNTINHAKSTLCSALQYAIYPAELILSNPALGLRVPKTAPRDVIKREIVSREKLQEILAAHPFGSWGHMPIQIAYHTGMRVGEVIGLMWNDIDFDAGTISVNRQCAVMQNVGQYLKAPKTASSVRTIVMDSQLKALLLKWKHRQKENELAMGNSYIHIYEDKDCILHCCSKCLTPQLEDWHRADMICTKPDGRMVHRDSLRKILIAFGTNSHSFRHTHATTLAEQGALPKDVAARLGQKDVSVTQNIYTHVTDKMRQSTADLFEDFLRAGNADK